MKQFLFPAIFYKEDDKYIVLFPDLNITTEAETAEEAFLFAKDSLKPHPTKYLASLDSSLMEAVFTKITSLQINTAYE